jgi:hypothetical protein
MEQAARTESGVLAYQRFVAVGDKLVHAYELYANSDAALKHLRNFRNEFSEPFLTKVERRRFSVYGRPTAELTQVLDGFGAIYFQRL